jgi:spermidine synthase
MGTDQAQTGVESKSVPTLLFLLAALFFLSGTSALIYQMLWLRLIGLVFGVTVYAASTVWAVFMAGLALGSVIGGRAADRVSRPLVWLGVAEALIAVTALATPAGLDLLQRAYAALHPSLSTSLVALTVVRLGMSFAVLIIPSSLMGATLPLIVKSSVMRAQGFGGRVSVLYATNTAGAIAGSLIAGLVLIPRVGIRGSFLVAAALNAIVAVVAVLAGSRVVVSRGLKAPALQLPEAPGSLDPGDHRAATIVLWVFALSGFISLALEVVWFRAATLFLRPTVYGYAMMLAAVLAGIALGSYAAAPLLRRRDPSTGSGSPRPFDELRVAPSNVEGRATSRSDRRWLMTLAWLEGGIAVAALLSFAVLPAIPQVMAQIGPAVSSVIGSYLAYQLIVSFIVILPTMILFGAAFPIGLHLWITAGRHGHGDEGSRVGTFYSLNVTGAIAGSLAAGFVLLPRLGSLRTLTALAGLALLSALALLAVSKRGLAVRAASAVILTAAFVATARKTPDPFDAFLAQRYAGQQIIWQREAVQATVSVHQEQGGTYSLNVSGNHQASTSGATPRVHQRIGNLPMAVHPDARQALVIGLGGGATAGALSEHTGVTVDVVELSREVTQAADLYFGPINFNVLRKPTVKLHVDDGRNFLLLTSTRYDVITADVILPIHAGSGNLYSAEYFRLARRALKPGGIVVQWVAGTDAEYKTIARTFLSVFPETTLWGDGTLMLGSVEPLRLRREDLEWKLQVPRRRGMIAMLGVKSFEDLLKLFVAGPDELRRFVGDGPILTDDKPMVEYFLSLPRDRDVNLSGVRSDVTRYVVQP